MVRLKFYSTWILCTYDIQYGWPELWKQQTKQLVFSLHDRQVKCSLQGTIFELWFVRCTLRDVNNRMRANDVVYLKLSNVSNFDLWAVLCGISYNRMRANDVVYLKLSICLACIIHAFYETMPFFWLEVIFGAFWHGVKYKTWECQAPPSFEQRKYR